VFIANTGEPCRTVIQWRRGESNPGPRRDRPQPLRA